MMIGTHMASRGADIHGLIAYISRAHGHDTTCFSACWPRLLDIITYLNARALFGNHSGYKYIGF